MANKASEMGCQATRAVGEYLLVNCVHHYPEVDPALVLEAAAPLEPEAKKKQLDDVAVYVHLLELVNVKSQRVGWGGQAPLPQELHGKKRE